MGIAVCHVRRRGRDVAKGGWLCSENNLFLGLGYRRGIKLLDMVPELYDLRYCT